MIKKAGRGLVVAVLLAAGCSSGGGENPSGSGGKGGTGGKAGVGGSATGGTAPSTGGQGGTAAGGSNAGGGGASAVGGAAGGNAGSGGAGGAGGGAPWVGPPANLPPALAVPSGATLKVHDHAIGAQVYTCTASTPAAGGAGGGGAGGTGAGGATMYAWVLKAPDAKLYDMAGAQVGTHGAGPNWTSTIDASVVNGAKVAQVDSPLADAIPWLLLRATSTTGTGVFSEVTYVQRANTTLGKAPATGCGAGTVGTEVRVDYTADYYFYTGGAGAEWLVEPNIPAAIAAPMGATLKLHDHAIGAQVYTCAGSPAAGGAGGAGVGGAGGAGVGGATAYAWTLKAPDAILYDATFMAVGTHGAGPNWSSTVDTSVVIGSKVSQADAPQSTAIPWLLLKATSTTGTGAFSDITYVHRVNTVGGKAPATGCDAAAAGTETRVNYSADYYFLTGGADGAGGTGGADGAGGAGGAAGAGGAGGGAGA